MSSDQDRDEKRKDPNAQADPGRTPGTAEGDRETVEADLREKLGDEAADDTEQRK
jgi:hypothetical protein